MARILGIDLGTSNSVMAVMDRTGPTVVPNSLGERITPSVVGFSKSGDILVGKKAKRGAIMNVGRTVFSIKRQMGTNHRVRIEGKEYTPQEIAAMILQKMKQDAEDYFGEAITQAVITVPAYFTDAQRTATKDAGEIAGLNVRRIIDEPTAAAIAYGLDKGDDQVILVYDLGGGTFDVSIIEITSGVFQVRAIAGNTRLGGDDFDKRLSDHLVKQFKSQHGVDLSQDPIAMQRLREAAEEAKIELSELKETHVLVEAITMTEKGPLTLDYTITRDEFDAMTKDFIAATVEPMQKALDNAGIEPSGIDTILLVGGSTRIPAIQRKVREFIGKNASRDISPEEVVARGAAVQTMVIAPLEGEGQESATRYENQPKDFQEAISFPIYEGESSTASDNIFLDLLRIEGITPAPKGVPRIEVTFRLNPDRILEVTAEDLATGVQKKVVVNATAERLTDDEKNRMVKEARERVAKMTLSKLSDSRGEEARHLLERAEATLAAAGGHSLATDLRFRADELREAIEAGNDSALEENQDELLRLLSEIEAGA